MIRRLYRVVDAAWGAVLDSPIGMVFHAPVELTHNDCIVCHWWRGAVLGAAAGFLASGHWVTALALTGVVALIMVGQARAETDPLEN